MDLQERVKRLEQENRWIKRMGAVAILLVGMVATLGFQAADEAARQFKERRSKLRQKFSQMIPIGEETKAIIDKLVENAKNGDTQAAEVILETIYRNTED